MDERYWILFRDADGYHIRLLENSHNYDAALVEEEHLVEKEDINSCGVLSRDDLLNLRGEITVCLQGGSVNSSLGR